MRAAFLPAKASSTNGLSRYGVVVGQRQVASARPLLPPMAQQPLTALGVRHPAVAEPRYTYHELQSVWAKDVDVDTLTAQLREAETERDMLEAQLQENEADSQRLMRHIGVLQQRRHQARDLLQQLQAALGDACLAAEEERLCLLAEQLQLCGRVACAPVQAQLRAREEDGMRRLQVYEQNLAAMTATISQVVRGFAGQQQQPQAAPVKAAAAPQALTWR